MLNQFSPLGTKEADNIMLIPRQISQERITPLVKSVKHDDYPLWQKVISRIMTLFSVSTGPLFTYFLFISCLSISDDSIAAIGLKNENAQRIFHKLFFCFCIFLVGMNQICDATSVNPIEDAENALDIIYAPATLLSPKAKFLAWLNLCLALPSFFIGACTDAISIALLVPSRAIQYCVGLPITLGTVIYYYMFSGKSLRRHASVLIEEIGNRFPAFRKRIRQAPIRLLEANIQVFSNTIYRGISFGYIMSELLRTVFKHDGTRIEDKILIFSTIALTVYIALLSRSLQVYDYFFYEGDKDKNLPGFEDILPETLDNARVSVRGFVLDALISLTRCLPIAVLIAKHNSFLRPGLSIALPYIISFPIFYCNMHALYQTRKLYTALEIQLNNDKRIIKDLNQEEVKKIPGASELFDEIANHYYKSKTIKYSTTFINFGGRISRLIGFIGFLVGLQAVLEKLNFVIPIDFYDILCLAFIWGIPTLVADGQVYQTEFMDVWSYYRAKIQVGAPDEKMANLQGENLATQGLFKVVRGSAGFLTSKKNYEISRLQTVLNELDNDASEKKPLLNNN